MSKIKISSLFIILIGLIIAMVFFQKNPDFVYEKWYMAEQKLIPIFFMHPKERIPAYISNADMLFSLSQKEQNPDQSLALAFRAEHSMTLLIQDVRSLQDTSIIPYSLIFDAYKRQKDILITLEKNSDNAQKEGMQTILQFADQNEKTTKTIYYNAIHPGSMVPN